MCPGAMMNRSKPHNNFCKAESEIVHAVHINIIKFDRGCVIYQYGHGCDRHRGNATKGEDAERGDGLRVFTLGMQLRAV